MDAVRNAQRVKLTRSGWKRWKTYRLRKWSLWYWHLIEWCINGKTGWQLGLTTDDPREKVSATRGREGMSPEVELYHALLVWLGWECTRSDSHRQK